MTVLTLRRHFHQTALSVLRPIYFVVMQRGLMIEFCSVTSVGGTQGFIPEEAWPRSSGGFSNYYPTPDYQAAAVSAYLAAHGSKNAGRFNASGRAFPDIAAKADNFVVLEPEVFFFTGTSAASPTVASIIALLNDRLLNAGRAPLGFLNPWLYSEGFAALTDITTGNSSVTCSENDSTRGFDAKVGWDPVCVSFGGEKLFC